MLRELGYPVDHGLLVTQLLPDTPAGVKRGDLLLNLDSTAIHSAADLAAKLKLLHYNDTVRAVFLTNVTYQGKQFPARRQVVLPVR